MNLHAMSMYKVRTGRRQSQGTHAIRTYNHSELLRRPTNRPHQHKHQKAHHNHKEPRRRKRNQFAQHQEAHRARHQAQPYPHIQASKAWCFGLPQLAMHQHFMCIFTTHKDNKKAHLSDILTPRTTQSTLNHYTNKCIYVADIVHFMRS